MLLADAADDVNICLTERQDTALALDQLNHYGGCVGVDRLFQRIDILGLNM